MSILLIAIRCFVVGKGRGEEAKMSKGRHLLTLITFLMLLIFFVAVVVLLSFLGEEDRQWLLLSSM